MLFARCFYKLKCLREVEKVRNLEVNNCCGASKNLNTCLEMDSLLHIETKKQKLRQTDKDFNFHSVSLLSQAPLERVRCEPLFTSCLLSSTFLSVYEIPDLSI